MAQSVSQTLSQVKSDATIQWQDKKSGLTTHQTIEFKDDNTTMVITRRSVFKDGDEVVQAAVIPIRQIDSSNMASHPSSEIEGIYYMDIFTRNQKKAIKVTTNYGGNVEKSIVDTHFYTIYSMNKDQSLELKEKIIHLIYLLGG
jgi:hypothetical protein